MPPFPSLRVVRDPDSEALAHHLAAELADAMVGLDPFVPVAIAVDAPPTGAWLRDVLAAHHGIAAQCIFPLAGRAIEDGLFDIAAVQRDPDRPDPWHPQRLLWPLLAVLADVTAAPTPATAVLATYLADTRPAGAGFRVSARAMALARRLAECFDRYVVHRPDLVAAWLQTPPPVNTAANPAAPDAWQAELLRRVAARIGPPGPRLVSAGLLAAPPGPVVLPPLRIFGLTGLPRTLLHWLWVQAHVRPVHLWQRAATDIPLALGADPDDDFFMSDGPDSDVTDSSGFDFDAWDIHVPDAPAPPSPSTSTSGAPVEPPGPPRLLHDLGRHGLDFDTALMALEAGDLDRTGTPAPFSGLRLPAWLAALPRPSIDVNLPAHASVAVSPPGNTLLQQLQYHLRTCSRPASPLRIAPNDTSLALHRCHGPMRQAEVLREVLLRILDEDQTLEPRDVLILSPDVEAHAPLLEAAFSQGARQPALGAPPRLPLRVIGRSVRHTNPFADLVMRLVALAHGRVSLTDVLELLALEPVRTRFALSENDLHAARTWLVEAGARWGLDAAWRVPFGMPEVPEHTFDFAIDRLAFGVVMGEDADLFTSMDAGADSLQDHESSASPRLVAPIPGLEGQAVAPLGGLMACLNALRTWLPRIRGDGGGRAIGEWVELLTGGPTDTGLLAAFAAPGAIGWQWDEVSTGLRELARDVDHSLPIAADAFTAVVAARFEVPVKGTLGSPAASGVTLAATGLAAGLPSKVLVLFGFDDGVFPAAGERPGFDLIARTPRPGDPDPRRTQRQTFLDALLQARQHLVVTWTGRDAVTDKKVAPAIVVAELLETLDATFVAPDGTGATHHLLREHPLQPFSEANFRPDGPGRGQPFSHQRRLVDAALARRQRGLAHDRDADANQGDFTSEGCWSFDAQLQVPLTIDALSRAIGRPAVEFYRHALQTPDAIASDGLDAPPDREPIGLGRPEDGGSNTKHAVWKAVVFEGARIRRDDISDTALQAAFRARGALPAGAAGPRVMSSVLEEARAQRAAALERLGPVTPELVAVETALPLMSTTMGPVRGVRLPGAIRLGATLVGPVANTLVHVARGNPDYADLDQVLRALALGLVAPSDPPPDVAIIGAPPKPDTPPKTLDLTPANIPGSAANWLADLALIALVAASVPLPLFSSAARAFVHSLRSANLLDAPVVRDLWTSNEPDRVARTLAHLENTAPDALAAAFDKADAAFGIDADDSSFGAARDLDDARVRTLFGHLRTLDDRDEPCAAVPGAGLDWTFAGLALRTRLPVAWSLATPSKSRGAR